MPLAEGLTPGTPQTFLTSQYLTARGRFSPDGRWISYQSDKAWAHGCICGAVPGPRRTDTNFHRIRIDRALGPQRPGVVLPGSWPKAAILADYGRGRSDKPLVSRQQT